MPAPEDVPAQAGEVSALALIKVDSLEQMRLWNEMLREHPQGAGPLVGAQMRYLIGSEHGLNAYFACLVTNGIAAWWCQKAIALSTLTH